MRSRNFLILASVALLFVGTACTHGGVRKHSKETKTPAAELEADFKTRWIAKRASDLTATGLAPSEAQDKAVKEFSEHYPYVGVRH